MHNVTYCNAAAVLVEYVYNKRPIFTRKSFLKIRKVLTETEHVTITHLPVKVLYMCMCLYAQHVGL